MQFNMGELDTKDREGWAGALKCFEYHPCN